MPARRYRPNGKMACRPRSVLPRARRRLRPSSKPLSFGCAPSAPGSRAMPKSPMPWIICRSVGPPSRASSPQQQCGGARATRHRTGSHSLALRRLRAWRRRNHVHSDSGRDAERRRSPTLTRRRAQQDRRSPHHRPCRAAPLELEKLPRDPRRMVTSSRPSSPRPVARDVRTLLLAWQHAFLKLSPSAGTKFQTVW